jgi:tellurite resistance protein
MVLAQVRLLPAYLRLPFMPSTWAFTFSWAAVASAALHWLNALRPNGYPVWQYLVLTAATVLVGAVALRTLVALARHQLLPEPTRPLRTAESAVGAPVAREYS